MFSVVYIICRDMEEAGRIARALVEERLVACANCDVVQSVYRWGGRIEQENEVSVLCKTTDDKVPEVIRRVKEMHSYELPCITWWRLDGGYQPYLDWVREETLTGHEAKGR